MVKNLTEVATILEKQINVIKYTLQCVTVIEWIFGGFLLGLAIALRWDTEIEEFIDMLDIWEFYIGVYILIFVALIMLLLPFLSCVSVYQEITQLLLLNAAGHCFCFLLLMIGNGILLQNSSVNSGVQESIRTSMKELIISSYDDRIAQRLYLIQEEVGCCGADGPNDYLILRKSLPNECKDTVTGSAHFHSCTDELTWFLEEKATWLSGIAYILGFMQMLIAVLSYILIEALRKEEKMAYRR